jgi:hypothetical protein
MESQPDGSTGWERNGTHGMVAIIAADLRVNELPLISIHHENRHHNHRDDASSDVWSLQPLTTDKPRHIHTLQRDERAQPVRESGGRRQQIARRLAKDVVHQRRRVTGGDVQSEMDQT